MAINLDYDIDLQLEAAATEAEIAATSEPELQHDDGLAGTPEDLSAAALYLREVARNPLLTPQEEIDFAQRNEDGRAAREELAQRRGYPAARAPHWSLSGSPSTAPGPGAGWSSATCGWSCRWRGSTSAVGSRSWISSRRATSGSTGPSTSTTGGRASASRPTPTGGFDSRSSRAVAEQARTIRLPVHVGEFLSSIARAQRELASRLGREPSLAEVAEYLELPVARVEETLRAAKLPISLETPVGEDGETSVGDLVPDMEATTSRRRPSAPTWRGGSTMPWARR